MEWNLKVKMSELANDKENKNNFYDFVVEHINSFDTQAWEIFSECVTIIPEEMEVDINFWEKVYEAINKADDIIDKGDVRTRMRIGIIKSICEEELKISTNG